MEKIAQDEKVRLAVFISRSVDRAVEIESAKQNIKKREFIELALREKLGPECVA